MAYFMAGINFNPGGSLGHFLILNPVASGIVIKLTSLRVYPELGGGGNSIVLATRNSALATSPTTVPAFNLFNATGSTTGATVQRSNEAILLAATVIAEKSFNLAGNDYTDFIRPPDYPFYIREGEGIMVANTSVNKMLEVLAQWEEN